MKISERWCLARKRRDLPVNHDAWIIAGVKISESQPQCLLLGEKGLCPVHWPRDKSLGQCTGPRPVLTGLQNVLQGRFCQIWKDRICKSLPLQYDNFNLYSFFPIPFLFSGTLFSILPQEIRQNPWDSCHWSASCDIFPYVRKSTNISTLTRWLVRQVPVAGIKIKFI